MGSIVFRAQAKNTVAALESRRGHDCLIFESFYAKVRFQLFFCDFGSRGEIKRVEAHCVCIFEALEVS